MDRSTVHNALKDIISSDQSINPTLMDSNMLYLEEKGLVKLFKVMDGNLWHDAEITALGIDLVEDMEKGNTSISEPLTSPPQAKASPLSDKVFIVHGHDVQPVKDLKVLLKELGLKPLVLHEKASGGLTLAEKLEKYSETVGYTFVILTPDDVGTEKSVLLPLFRKSAVQAVASLRRLERMLKPRARQNVIFEMGYFWGLLKRKKVCCLLKGEVERPSDIEGIVYIPFKDSVNERRDMIIKELREAKFAISSQFSP